MRWNVNDPLRGLNIGLGDMGAEQGTPVRWQLVKAAPQVASRVFQLVADTPAYQLISEILPSEKVEISLVNRVKREILPVIRALYIAKWHSENGMAGERHEIVWDHHGGLGPALKAVWPDDAIPLILGNESNIIYPKWRPLAARLYRQVRQLPHQLLQKFSFKRSLMPTEPKEATIAVHYIEGLDPMRRSDIFWHEPSLVDPERILVFFQGRPQAPHSVLQEIEALGMRWVCLQPGQIAKRTVPIWTCDPRPDSLLNRFQLRKIKATEPTERWTQAASESFLGHVDYWTSFYEAFNVKVHAEVGGSQDDNMAQSIALDLTGGVRVGWQRSEQMTAEGTDIGHHPNHAYFAWSARVLADSAANRHRLGPVIVSGFPYDRAWGDDTGPKQLRESLSGNGARFVVSLFDNMIVPEGSFSKTMVLAWYKSFLNWIFEDPQLGVITKSKRPNNLEQLPEIHQLMADAEATGRWINLTETHGRLPSDASRAADMSVGLGISTAVNEAVSAGGKAIHCDLPAMRYHPYYQWGYGKVVFDDLDQMMRALKRYKVDPANELGLGDFSPFIEQVDPFRDGMAAERIGSFISCLLAGFDAGMDRNQTFDQANVFYGSSWGFNHVIYHQIKSDPVAR